MFKVNDKDNRTMAMTSTFFKVNCKQIPQFFF